MAALVVAATCVVLGPGSAAGAAPRLSVSPTTGLAAGSPVTVRVSGLPAGAAARVIQCDQFNDSVELDCPDLATATAGPKGFFSTSVALRDPVFRSQPFGDGTPVYCRADVCRIFVVWVDGEGATQVLTSPVLWFKGAPATIVASPSTDLAAAQLIRASGTAKGAAGRTVELVEEACFAIVQGSGCYGTSTLGTTVVGRDGSWSRRVRVHRFLADGTDCTDPGILGQCQLTVRVLDWHGVPDDTFGVSRIGDPGQPLTFAT